MVFKGKSCYEGAVAPYSYGDGISWHKQLDLKATLTDGCSWIAGQCLYLRHPSFILFSCWCSETLAALGNCILFLCLNLVLGSAVSLWVIPITHLAMGGQGQTHLSSAGFSFSSWNVNCWLLVSPRQSPMIPLQRSPKPVQQAVKEQCGLWCSLRLCTSVT